jgi:hypothetical protein
MRARWLKPEFFADKKIAQLGPIAALVYEALWCMADDGGTAPCDPDTVKAQMFYRWSAVGVPEISEALRHLSESGRIVVYDVGDDFYARIPTWKKHQQVHKPSKFRYPAQPKEVTPLVPGDSGTSAAPLPASPHTRHLDSQTPKDLPAGAGTNGKNGHPEPHTAGKLDVFPKAVCDAGYEAYIQRVAPINYGRYRKALLPIYESKLADHPTARQLVDATEAFAEAIEADDPKFRHKYTLAAFVNGLRNYIRLGALPLTDEWGEPTERGRMAGIGA